MDPQVLRHLRQTAVAVLVAALSSGCLGHVYEIPREELERIVKTPAPERGHDLFAVQQFVTAREPEPAPDWAQPEGDPPPGYSCSISGHWIPDFYVHYGAPYYEPRVSFHLASAVGGSSVSGGGSGGSSHSSSAVSTSDAKVPSIGGGNDGGVLIVAAIVVGVAVGVGLVLSEGARYDGTIAVHPHHPVHLVPARGHERVVALDELTADQLQPDVRALIVGDEGAGLWLRERAPLNRQGFSFQFGGGYDALALPGGVQNGLGFRFAAGYFPTRWLGLLAESRLMTGSYGDNGYHNVRGGLEAQVYPIGLWRLHLGAFGGVGQAAYGSGGSVLPTASGSRSYVAFGGIAELDLTSRLGLAFRWTEDWLPESRDASPRLSHSWSLGFSIY